FARWKGTHTSEAFDLPTGAQGGGGYFGAQQRGRWPTIHRGITHAADLTSVRLSPASAAPSHLPRRASGFFDPSRRGARLIHARDLGRISVIIKLILDSSCLAIWSMGS
ncbi:hypothetical protein ABZP36_023430, partial [Zizania latifolia]